MLDEIKVVKNEISQVLNKFVFKKIVVNKLRVVSALLMAAGGKAVEDPPGERKGPFGTLVLAYLRDPAGNKVCAVHRPG